MDENTPPRTQPHTKKKGSDPSVLGKRKPLRERTDPRTNTVDEPRTTTRDRTSSVVTSHDATPMVPKPSKRTTMLLVEQEGILEFTEGRVAANKFREGLPAPAESFLPGTEVVGLKMNTAYYQGSLIGRDEVVRACKVYRDPDNPTSVDVGLLVQDHTGKVTDYSGNLSKEQKTEIAFKQAQMMLANFREGHGDLIIRGKSAERANMVFAALLVFRDAHPDIRHIPIKSWVPGCKGPDYVWHTRDSVAEKNFIKQHLLTSKVQGEGTEITEQLYALTKSRQKRFKDMYAILKQPNKSHAQKEDEIDKYSLHDGDRLDVSGKVTRSDQHPEAESDSTHGAKR